MSSRTHVLPLGFGLSAVLCFATSGSGDEPPARPAARVYTNDDLDRVHPFSDETGVRSVPAVAAPAHDADVRVRGERREAARGRGEPYWRRQAETTREKVRRLTEQAEELRARIAREEDLRLRTSSRTHRNASSPFDRANRVAALQERLLALERRARQLEEDLADRARREGALPGWLR